MTDSQEHITGLVFYPGMAGLDIVGQKGKSSDIYSCFVLIHKQLCLLTSKASRD
jgi:hypothetical protein